MGNFKNLPALAVAATMALGCAPAYHSYSGCYVECDYCAPPPLPYTWYDGCACHPSAAANYLYRVDVVDNPELDRFEVESNVE